MSILTRALSRLRKKSTVLATGSISDPSAMRRLESGPTFSGETVTAATSLGLSSVWGCVNLLAGTIASLPIMVYRRDGDARIIDRGHPLYRVLHETPNFDQTALDFWEFMQASLELWGNAYAKIERSAGRVVALRPINPAFITIRRLASGALEYNWTDEGRQFTATDRDLLHIRGFGGAPLGGMSTLQFARQSFALAQAVDKSASGTFANGLSAPGALTFESWLSAEQREVAEQRMVEKYIGARNFGKPMILEGGTKWEQLSINPEDAQMLETRRFSVEEICRFFGVPPHMIGHTETSTSWGTGLEQQTLAFQKFTLRRRIKRIEQALMKSLLTPAERAAGYLVEFNLEGLLRADSGARSAFYASGLQNGWLTINEVRALENKPPVAGGETPRMQMQNVPITEAGNGV